jgi:hypothetical protein
MGEISIQEASKRQLDQWDDFVWQSVNGTLFHTRAFLGYHGNRFSDAERYLVVLNGDSVEAQISYATQHPRDGLIIGASPYGASYGGIVLRQIPTYELSKKIVEALIEFARIKKLDGWRLTHPIACCTLASMDVFTFALLEQGYRSAARDISSVADLSVGSINSVVGSRARNTMRKAQKLGVEIVHRADLLDFFVTMDSTFSRHETKPTHTHSELIELCNRLPDKIYVDVAYFNGLPVGGVCYLHINKRVLSSFYFCQTPDGAKHQSLTLLIMEGLRRAQEEGYLWLDFGTSSVGMRARANIFRFKESFSRIGMFRETLEWQKN